MHFCTKDHRPVFYSLPPIPRSYNLSKDEIIPMIDRGLCASVYTQVSGVEDETNGLVTYDRQVVKVKKEDMTEISDKLNEAFYKQL